MEATKKELDSNFLRFVSSLHDQSFVRVLDAAFQISAFFIGHPRFAIEERAE